MKFSKNDINKCILLLQKSVYPCEYMDDCEKFNETRHRLLACKKSFFLLERIRIEKVEKIVTNVHEKTKQVIHTRNLKQALNHDYFEKAFIK